MDLVAYFLTEHAAVHAVEVGRRTSVSQRVLAEPTDAQMRVRPGPGLNSLVWLLWHMARTEDVAVNLVVARRDQVLDSRWAERMNVSWRNIGTGMTADEVAELSERADVAAVRAYRAAVGLRTREVVQALAAAAWEEVVDEADIRRAAATGAFRDWVDGERYPWQGWTRAAQLASSAVRHNAAHIGEAVTLRGLAGFGVAL